MNVIKFPKENPRIEETSIEGIQKKLDDAKEKYINSLVDQHCGQLLANISFSGFNIEHDDFMKDFAFTVETIRASMYRNMGLDHPLHEQISNAITLVDSEDDSDMDDSFIDDEIFPPLSFDDDDDE